MLDVDVVRAWADEGGGCVIILFGFGFHAVERDIGLRYFIFPLDLKVIRTYIIKNVPGPTIWFGLLPPIF